MTRAAIYARISQARRDAEGRKTDAGVIRQREDCQDFARKSNWDVVDVFEDNDISAYSGKRRPEYERMLQGVREGRYDVIVAWDGDRLFRRPADLEEFVALVEAHEVQVATLKSGSVDLTTSGGRLHARIMGSVARHESEHKGERVARARRQEAERGQMHGPLGYGWRQKVDGSWRIYAPEAKIVREIASRLLDDQASLAGIARDLNARGVPSPSGRSTWRGGNIRSSIVAARYCGWREYTPRGPANPDGRGRGFGNLVAEGDWPPILTKAQTEALRLLLSDVSRGTRRPASELLVGLLVCGKCGGKMSAVHPKTGKFRYRCTQQPGLSRCGGSSIAGPPCDDLIASMIVTVLDSSVANRVHRKRPAEDVKLRASLEGLTERETELAEQYGLGKIKMNQWRVAQDTIDMQVAAINERLAQNVQSKVPYMSANERRTLARDWDGFSLAKQRQISRDLIRSIIVQPPGARSPVFDPRRIADSVDWKV